MDGVAATYTSIHKTSTLPTYRMSTAYSISSDRGLQYLHDIMKVHCYNAMDIDCLCFLGTPIIVI